MLRIALPLFALTTLALPAGCASRECGPNTSEKVDPMTGVAQCVPSANGGGAPIPCNVDAGARLVGGVCEGDPAQYPRCGEGTKLDEKSRTCVPTGGGAITAPPCAAPMGDKVCINGVVRYLRDGTNTKGRKLEVRAYDPFAFLGDPKNAVPLAVGMTDENGTYILPSVPAPALMTIAVAVTDVGGPIAFPLSGSGADNVTRGNSYSIDLFAVEATTVAAWDQQLGFSGMDTFEAKGAYVGIFVSGKETTSPPVAGVVMTLGGKPAVDQFFFKNDRASIDKTAMATDAATGSAVQRIASGLDTYSGTGGGVARWESGPGTSVAGVVFVQVFHPEM